MMPIRQEAVGRVLVVTIDNPRVRNAFDKMTCDTLRAIFDGVAFRDALPVDAPDAQDAQDAPDIGPQGRYRPHAIVLRATGPVFCAGAHLGEMKSLGQADYQTNLAAAMDMGGMFRAVRTCPVPVVARVQGPAYGGGVGLVAACDIVVAGPAAKFAFSEVRLGLVPGVISPLVIGRLGQAAARHYFLTGDAMAADEALRLGLVDRLATTQEELDGELNAVIDSLLKGGAAALSLCKSLLEGAESLGFNRSAELCARMIAEARTGGEGQAALAAFAAKEKAPWLSETNWPGVPATPEEGTE
ncbi:hypothetical protein CSA17_01305 [bacterium DOLJORAL78_65_58]|nr:MAG: hypothetical protein CSB20_14820 [bacterium DOLZORAL124_64_63]PIE76608.1 MAG: hypothetical protein CSA17_01305 [bacterium DOLJORAL78_65_58]